MQRFEEDTLMEDTGGILFKEVPFKPDVSFPAWMEGEWEVKAKIAEVTLPVEKFAPADAAFVADTPWSPLGPRLFPSEQDKGREVSYRLRFSRTWAGVQQDWRANYQAIINAYNAAPLLAAQDVLQQERRNESPEYKVVARSWLSDAESRGGSVRLRQVRSFGTDRCSRCRSHASWQFLDLSVNTADGAELLNRRIELITSLRLAGSNSGFLGLDKPRAAPDDKVLAKQRLALYLQEGDPQYTMSRTYAVALIDMELEMERVDSGGSAAAAAAERSANCDNGCDA